MKKHITQKDEICLRCSRELPKGSYVWLDGEGEIMCRECYEEVMFDKVSIKKRS